MYDGIDEDLEYLPRAVRYTGERRPAEIIEAIQPDLQWALYKCMEWGYDLTSAYEPVIRAEAYLQLAKSSPHWNVPVDMDEQDLLEIGDHENFVFGLMVEELLTWLDGYTQIYMRYGWGSEDPAEELYEQLGVWVDWEGIDRDVELGKIVPISHPDDMADDMLETGARFALIEGDGFVELYDIKTRDLVWEVS